MIAPRELPKPELRPVTTADLPACATVFYAGLNEYMSRANQPLLPRNENAMVTFFSHLLATDPERAWLVEGPEGIEGFGLAHLRGAFWFLSFLFVQPAAQARGIGHRLLLRLFPHEPASRTDDAMGGATAWPGVLATCIDSLQPVSTALYARYGLVPRVPIFTMLGRPRSGALPPLPAGVERVAFEGLADGPDGNRRLMAAIAALDHELLGYERHADHRAWRLAARRGTLYRDRVTGDDLGYGYAQQSGRLGPIALRDGTLAPAVLGDLMGTLEPAGDWQAFVPGSSDRAMVALLRAGFRLDGTPAIYCASGPGPDLARYLPASFALL